MKTACALLAAYNEADIILESVTKLIRDGIDVFVIDNGSTDGTAELLAPLVGKGIVDIQSVRFQEDGREVYDWTSILRLKENLSRRMAYDWFLHVDADEVRYAPWPGYSLREGLDKVDRSGYSLVNFKLYNFRLTEDIAQSDDYERDMPLYSAGEHFNQYQVKAWKAHKDIDIVANGGHIARRPDGRIYPVRFVHKHYPVRSLEHGKRKIILERKQRFSVAEKQRGWHVQYDSMQEVKPEDVFWGRDTLARFEMADECMDLLREGADVACGLLATVAPEDWDTHIERYLVQRFAKPSFLQEHAVQLLGVSRSLVAMASRGEVPPIEAAPDDLEFMQYAVQLLAARRWLTGDAAIFQRVATMALWPVELNANKD